MQLQETSLYKQQRAARAAPPPLSYVICWLVEEIQSQRSSVWMLLCTQADLLRSDEVFDDFGLRCIYEEGRNFFQVE